VVPPPHASGGDGSTIDTSKIYTYELLKPHIHEPWNGGVQISKEIFKNGRARPVRQQGFINAIDHAQGNPEFPRRMTLEQEMSRIFTSLHTYGALSRSINVTIHQN
jgi:hypothetical protein